MSATYHYQPDNNAPRWFLENIQTSYQSIETVVNTRTVHMLAWNWDNDTLPTLMLVHGFGAHAHWWSFLAPFFRNRYRVVALDLPGMGDSEAPLRYEDGCFAAAIIGCIEQHQLAPVTLVGHSFGGAQSIRASGLAPHLFKRVVVVDSNVRLPPEPLIRRLQPKGTHKQSPTHEECMSRFRVVPAQPNDIEAVINYIAFHSCTQDADGWHWKADPNCLNVGEIEDPAILEAANVHIDMIYGEKSFLNVDQKPQRVFAHFPLTGELRIIPNAGHHLMVDHPLELVAELNSLLSAP